MRYLPGSGGEEDLRALEGRSTSGGRGSSIERQIEDQAAARSNSIQAIRRELGGRLRHRLGEIEDAIFVRILTLGELPEAEHAEYTAGLKNAIREAVDLAITSIEQGPEWNPPAPAAMVVQAQLAARSGVSIDAVLRRYATGDRIVGEFIVEEADRLPGHVVGQVMKNRGPLVDALMTQAATHYERELRLMSQSPEQRRRELVEKLLAGDGAVSMSELDYEFESWHLGAILVGEDVEAAAAGAARQLGGRALIVPSGPRTAWLWLGDDRPLDPATLEHLLDGGPLADVSVARGEPRWGLEGWRLSHQEARAAHQVMARKPQKLMRGAEVALLAAVLRDDDLARSLSQTHLAPLDGPGNSGEVLRRALRAYFASGHNAATAAAALGVDRHTVKRRLRKVEELLGRRLDQCQAGLEVALDLEEIGGPGSPGPEGEEPEAPRRPRLAID